MEVIDPNRALMFWHVYDKQGSPLTLYVEGEIHGRRIEGVAYAPKGMRFGEFNPADLNLPVWGEVDMDFDDCSHAKLQWQSDDAAFGSGEMAVEKLAHLQQDECRVSPPDVMKPGLYEGGVIRGYADNDAMVGLVDYEGRLWAKADGFVGRGWGAIPPGPVVNPGFHWKWQAMASAQPPADDCAAPVEASLMAMAWGGSGSPRYRTRACWHSTVTEGVDLDFGELAMTLHESSSVRQVQPLRMTDLARTWRVWTQQQFVVVKGELRIEPDGRFCLVSNLQLGPDCNATGQISLPDGDQGIFDYRVDRSAEYATQFSSALAGRGWLTLPGEPRLHMAGPGMALLAVPE